MINFNLKSFHMLNNRVIYQKPQSKFLEEADLNQVANEMLKEANRIWLHPWESEINSWEKQNINFSLRKYFYD